MDRKNESISAKAGRLLGIIFVACLTLIFGSAAIISTIKLVSAFTLWMLF